MTQQTATTQLYAYLSAAWVEITTDYLTDNLRVSYGIRGNGPLDILASAGSLTFTLKNNTGKYYPDGPNALAGWGYGTRVKLVITALGDTRRWHGRVGSINFIVGKTDNDSFVDVTVLDWMEEANKYPMLAPDIEVNKKANEGITTLLSLTPIDPEATSLDTGDYIFPTIFDSGGLHTTAYAELAKLINSEWGHAYIKQDKTNGETLTFEKASHRSVNHQQPVILDYLTTENDDFLHTEDGDRLELDGAILLNGYDVKLSYGSGIVNYFTVSAYPRRVDTEPTILYSLDNPLPIAAGETLTFRAGYKDQTGGGARVNAIVSSMLTPEVPGATDTTLKALLQFDNATDATGLRTWTNAGDVTFENDTYSDGFGVTRLVGSINGKFGVFGGFADYKLTTPNSADLDFGSGAYTVGFYVALFNPTDGNNPMSRKQDTNYPAYMVICHNGEMKLCMSSNGSSLDIANRVSFGKTSVSRWVHYEFSGDGTGWHYLFTDGKLMNKFYSALSPHSGGGTLSIGYTEGTYWAYMAMDMFYIHKGKCLHTRDFDPPKTKTTTLPGDYLMNTAKDGTGTDISADLTIVAVYDSAGVNYTLTNGNASDGYITYLTARGLGVYQYNPIEESVGSTVSQNTYGYKTEMLQQRYQQELTPGLALATDVITNEAAARTEIESVSFYANRSELNMRYFLAYDVGDLMRITHLSSGTINQAYYVQSVDFEIRDNIIRCTYGLRKDFEH